MVACTTRATGRAHLGMWCVRKYPVIYGCNLRQSLGWPERAPSTNPCALRALDSPHRCDLTVTAPSALSQSPSRTTIPLGFYVPTIGTTLGALRTPQQPLTLASISKESGRGQGKPLELLTSPPPTWDSPLPSRIKPYTSWGCLAAKPQPPTTSSNHPSHIT